MFEQVQAVLAGKTNTARQETRFSLSPPADLQELRYSLIGETAKGFTYYRCHTDPARLPACGKTLWIPPLAANSAASTYV